MPAKHDLDPPAMTEGERLDKRRYEAYFAFETMQNRVPERRAHLDHFGQGITEGKT